MKDAKWTAIVRWFGDPAFTEEVDVTAPDVREARVKVQKALETDYEPGGKIVRIVPAGGLGLVNF